MIVNDCAVSVMMVRCRKIAHVVPTRTSTAQRPVAPPSPPCSSMSTRYPVTGSTASSLNSTPSDASPRDTAPCVHPQPRSSNPHIAAPS